MGKNRLLIIIITLSAYARRGLTRKLYSVGQANVSSTLCRHFCQLSIISVNNWGQKHLAVYK